MTLERDTIQRKNMCAEIKLFWSILNLNQTFLNSSISRTTLARIFLFWDHPIMLVKVHSSFMLQFTPLRNFDISELNLKKQVFSSIFVYSTFCRLFFPYSEKRTFKTNDFCFILFLTRSYLQCSHINRIWERSQ